MATLIPGGCGFTAGSPARALVAAASTALSLAIPLLAQHAPIAVSLPPGVEVVWDLAKSHRETTPTRERICINGLWRWQPADASAAAVPKENWGFFKVPGPWPGITDYLQKDSQMVHAHPAWANPPLRDISAAWYQREISIPADWSGRRLALTAETLNSFAAVFVDGRRVGELTFPGGELDLTDACRPGSRHELSLLVLALPLHGVLLAYTDSASAREVKGKVDRRGLCGDVFLLSEPRGPRVTGVRVATSVRRGEIAAEVALAGLEAGRRYSLRGSVWEDDREVKRLTPRPFTTAELSEGRLTLREAWRPERLWDIHTPDHQYDLRVTLRDAAGVELDVRPPARFGFREFWIEGRDFYLNGTRLFLSAVPLDNAQVGAAAATYAAARESFARLRTFGINFVYAHNYDCQPGAHLSFGEILRAADDCGMLVALTQPHFSAYAWTGPEAGRTNGYARHAAFYADVAGNHPSVVMYATSHNATGYYEDMNPDLMDGRQDRRDSWAANNVRRALQAEAIIRSLDPHRIIYHHASGNLGPMHLSNFYPNFVPVQELSDWFGHWATNGVKPVFLCEYGAPFSWDWAMYRGWYQGRREFGSAAVPWEFCLAEWNAQFLGDAAFAISEAEKRNLRWEARQFREGRAWHRWDYPHPLGSTDFAEREPIFARYFSENWRAFRTWGLSANSPWEHDILFKLRPGLNRNRREALPVHWANLQRPGFSPDFLEQRYERMDLAYERADWLPTLGAEALIRNNRPLLAWIAGKPGRFTSKDHLFVPGERFAKQLIVINNSRLPVRADCVWSLALPTPVAGRARLQVETGEQARVPLSFTLPGDLGPGEYRLSARVEFDPGEVQEDEFAVHVLPPPAAKTGSDATSATGRLAVFDPRGETAEWLRDLGFTFDRLEATASLAGHEWLVIGKGALTVDGPAPDLRRVREGLRVLVFEQTSEVLEKRLGFRVTEYGLRNVFPRVPDHPALAGLTAEHLRDWRGEATLLPPRLKYEANPKFYGAPTVTWCGLPVTRLWRCGNQGNVASVLIEKPARGNFLPLLEGGFSLQYSPLLEFREGRGVMLFCQMDVTGRTEAEPAARALVANLLAYLTRWQPEPEQEALYVGDPAGLKHLQAAGFQVNEYHGGDVPRERVLVAGAGESGSLAAHREPIARFLAAGGRMVAFEMGEADAAICLPEGGRVAASEHINAVFAPPALASPFAGIGPADVHSRAPRVIPLVSDAALVLGNGVLAAGPGARVVICQVAPWRFDDPKNYGLKRTFRRTSFLAARLLANAGVAAETPLLARWSVPVRSDEPGRWLEGLYLDLPEEWDDPYRFFRW